MKIVGVLPSLSFIKYIIQSHVFQNGVMTLGRPEFYFVMTPAHYFVSIFLSSKHGLGSSEGLFCLQGEKNITIKFRIVLHLSVGHP